MNKLRIIAVSIVIVLFASSCSTVPSATPSGPRSIILNGETYSETDLGKFSSWRCNDYVYNTDTLVEVGSFIDPDFQGSGFILYDGGYSGESTIYRRKGINHRWDWGPNGNDYAFVIKPDGTGLFYDFSPVPEGETVKADAVYKCHRA